MSKVMKKYRRTVSFPNPIPSFNPNTTPKSKHVRSVSLPCSGTHPFIPQLRAEIMELRVWAAEGELNQTGSTRIIEGLTRLKSIMDSFDNVLQLPQTQDSLSTAIDVVERLLEDFLRFVDVYDTFCSSMLGLRQEISSAQVAIRRNDDFTLGLYVKAQKKIACEISKLISIVGSIVDHHIDVDFQDEIVDVIHDVHGLIVSVSGAVFSGFGPCRKPCWVGFGLRKGKKEEGVVEEFVNVLEGVENLMELRKKKNSGGNSNEKEEMKMGVLRKMQEMEDFVGEIERESERVFRSLISTRVSLLNILTHA